MEIVSATVLLLGAILLRKTKLLCEAHDMQRLSCALIPGQDYAVPEITSPLMQQSDKISYTRERSQRVERGAVTDWKAKERHAHITRSCVDYTTALFLPSGALQA